MDTEEKDEGEEQMQRELVIVRHLASTQRKMFRYVYLFTSYVALICTCIDMTNFQTARAVKLVCPRGICLYKLYVGVGVVDIFYNYGQV